MPPPAIATRPAPHIAISCERTRGCSSTDRTPRCCSTNTEPSLCDISIRAHALRAAMRKRTTMRKTLNPIHRVLKSDFWLSGHAAIRHDIVAVNPPVAFWNSGRTLHLDEVPTALTSYGLHKRPLRKRAIPFDDGKVGARALADIEIRRCNITR